jgi:Spy/CpxP family protein refolding chaperone
VRRAGLAIALFAAAPLLWGQPGPGSGPGPGPGGGGGFGKWWKRPHVAQALKLTPAQTDELEKIFAKSRPKLIDLRAEFEKKQFAYEQAMGAEKVNRKAVETAIEEREQARAKLQKELALMEIDMKQALTAEQWDRLMQMREEMRRRMQQRRRGGPPED